MPSLSLIITVITFSFVFQKLRTTIRVAIKPERQGNCFKEIIIPTKGFSRTVSVLISFYRALQSYSNHRLPVMNVLKIIYDYELAMQTKILLGCESYKYNFPNWVPRHCIIYSVIYFRSLYTSPFRHNQKILWSFFVDSICPFGFDLPHSPLITNYWDIDYSVIASWWFAPWHQNMFISNI